mmetsp:Transcript_32980/g.61488  ORF Transcript_32980/g.61488 Transcript_32980/m.61488 type:complete len:218 (-) Transcript_32980:179-832(-)
MGAAEMSDQPTEGAPASGDAAPATATAATQAAPAAAPAAASAAAPVVESAAVPTSASAPAVAAAWTAAAAASAEAAVAGMAASRVARGCRDRNGNSRFCGSKACGSSLVWRTREQQQRRGRLPVQLRAPMPRLLESKRCHPQPLAAPARMQNAEAQRPRQTVYVQQSRAPLLPPSVQKVALMLVHCFDLLALAKCLHRMDMQLASARRSPHLGSVSN